MSTTPRHLEVVLDNPMRNYLDEFYLSLQGDSNSIKSFLGRLSTLNDNIRTHRHKLQKETLVAARSLVNTIDTVISGILDIQKANDSDDMASDITKILDEKMGNLAVTDSENLTQTNESLVPAYIQPSLRWLLDNLHNPYPSKDKKNEISRQTNCSVRDIDAWFIDVRKRIGWNKLRKTQFHNKQEKIVAAATRFFKPKPSSFSDDLNTSLISEIDTDDSPRSKFIAMANTARSLYVGRFPELGSPSISCYPYLKLANSPMDMIQTQSITSLENEADCHHYPTPEPSPPTYPVEECPSSNSVFIQTELTSRKRRQSFREESEQTNDDTTCRPTKRIRSNERAVSRAITPILLMQPSVVPIQTPEIPLLGCIPPEKTTLKRKRRLSDGENQLSSKRPNNALCVPRLQTVSDPIPTNQLLHNVCVSDWPPTAMFSSNDFSDVIPSPASDEGLTVISSYAEADLPSYDISAYDPGFYISGDSNYPLDSPPSLVHDSFSPSDAPEDDTFDLTDPLNLQFSFPAPLSVDFHCANFAADSEPVIFENPGLISLSSGYIPDSSLLGDMYSLNNLEPNTSIAIKAAVLENFSHVTHSRQEQVAKRARAQALREELALYEAEGL